ncbi:MAG TPA: PAS domain-containing protein [Pseudolabrys sp.]|nr:PAS domain-containing protein [Pseudolabrys sp.]
MKQPSTRALYAYWDERRGQRPAPEREDIDPVAIRHVLGDTFMLSADFVDETRFRLAGTRVCALFCRELKGEAFTSLWAEASRARVANLIEMLRRQSIGSVASLTGRTRDGARVDLEMLLLPLAYRDRGRTRALGALSPIETPYWIGESPLGELELGEVQFVRADGVASSTAERSPAAMTGQMRHGFVVYRGGRDRPPRSERTG